MTRFQVVADYLLKIPIYTTSCKFVKGTFINTQWQMKFYDFVCVFICVFKNFYASKFLNWTKKKWNFILPVTQSPVIACAQQQNKRRRTSEKSVREKRHIFKMKVTFCMKNFRRKEREGSNYYPSLLSSAPLTSAPLASAPSVPPPNPPIFQNIHIPPVRSLKKIKLRVGGMWIEFPCV